MLCISLWRDFAIGRGVLRLPLPVPAGAPPRVKLYVFIFLSYL